MFLRLLCAHMIGMVGVSATPVALTWAMLETGHGAGGIGAVLGSESAAMLALLLLGGVVGDLIAPRTVLLAANALLAAAQGLIGFLLLQGYDHLPLLCVLSACIGVGRAFLSPAQSCLLVMLGTPATMHRLNVLSGLAAACATMVGPALGGIMVAAASPGAAMLVSSATSLLSLLSLYGLPHTPCVVRLESRVLHMAAAGWKEFRSRNWLWAIVLQFGLLQLLCFSPFYVDGPLLIGADSAGAQKWSLILAGEGVGAVLGGFAAYHMQPRRPMLWCAVSTFPMALPLVLLAARAPFAIVALGMVACGFAIATSNALWNSTLQQQVPLDALARVKGLETLGTNGMAPLGYALAGPMASWIGASSAMWIASLVIIVSTTAVLCMPSVRNLRWSRMD